MMNFDEKIKKGIVMPISNMVLLPGMVHILRLNKMGAEQLELLSNEGQYSIALPLMKNFEQGNLKVEDFHKVGVLFKADGIERTEKGYKVTIRVSDRIEIKELTIGNDAIVADFEIAQSRIVAMSFCEPRS